MGIRTSLKGAINTLAGAIIADPKRHVIESGANVWWPAIRGIGHLRVGGDSSIDCRIDFDSPDGLVVIGQRCFIGKSHLVCHTGITIGDDVIISWGVTIVDHDSHPLEWERRQYDVEQWRQARKDWSAVTVAPVVIERRSWIGFGATLLKGVTIGEGSVVGAKAVVTRDVPPFSVAAGNPARVVKSLRREVA